jgi:hypothetical protein
MASRLRHGLRTWSFGLAVLLLVPLLARAHTHHDEVAKPTACAVCVATQHSPTLAPPAAACPVPVLRTILLGPAPSTILLARVVHAHGGRAPPAPLPSRFA